MPDKKEERRWERVERGSEKKASSPCLREVSKMGMGKLPIIKNREKMLSERKKKRKLKELRKGEGRRPASLLRKSWGGTGEQECPPPKACLDLVKERGTRPRSS